MTHTVSVVVPSRNSARTTAACLAPVRAQRGVDLTLVVVDNHSTDATLEIAQRTPDTLAVALADAHRSGVRAVAIGETSVCGGFWSALRALEGRCYLDDQLRIHNLRLLRRDLFDELRGCDESMAGPEDADLRLKLRDRDEPIGYARDVLIEHDEGVLTLRGVWDNRVHYGRCLPALTDRHPGAVQDQAHGQIEAYWRNRGILLRDPVRLAGMVFLPCAEAVGYLIGAARGRVARRSVR
jgi:arabinofuranan 3-O-arabinosyltransferase